MVIHPINFTGRLRFAHAAFAPSLTLRRDERGSIMRANSGAWKLPRILSDGGEIKFGGCELAHTCSKPPRGTRAHRVHLARNTHAMEDAMARPKLLSNSVPRVELDHRARDARNRLVQIERLLVPRASVAGFWLSPLVRLLGSRAGGSRRRDDRDSGSQSDPRLGCMSQIDAVWPSGRSPGSMEETAIRAACAVARHRRMMPSHAQLRPDASRSTKLQNEASSHARDAAGLRRRRAVRRTRKPRSPMTGRSNRADAARRVCIGSTGCFLSKSRARLVHVQFGEPPRSTHAAAVDARRTSVNPRLHGAASTHHHDVGAYAATGCPGRLRERGQGERGRPREHHGRAADL